MVGKLINTAIICATVVAVVVVFALGLKHCTNRQYDCVEACIDKGNPPPACYMGCGDKR